MATAVELARIRSLDDFLLGQARFQLPPYRDLERWSHRVLSNLLYYQTNYMVVVVVFFMLVGLVHPRDVALGCVAVALAAAAVVYATSKRPDVVEFKQAHPLVSLFAIVAVGYLLVTLVSSVVVFLYALALPLLLTLVHASIRLRNLKNKVAEKMEAVGLKKTPMGELLELLGVEVELIGRLN